MQLFYNPTRYLTKYMESDTEKATVESPGFSEMKDFT